MLLTLSNGAGEDSIAASILMELRELRPDLKMAAFPLVGRGAAYPDFIPLWGEQTAPPSQGLSNQSLRLWWGDVRNGLAGRVWRQWRELHGRRAEISAVLAVGDLFPCVLAGLAGAGPIYFVGTAKSVYHHAYGRVERWLLRRWVRSSAVRDAATAHALQSHGLAAHYLGNAMMDETVPRGLDLGLAGEPVLTLFPGSRAQAVVELPRQLRIWQRLYPLFPCRAAVALAEGLELERLAQACPGWTLESRAEATGWIASLVHPGLPPVHLIRRALGDLLATSRVALGQAGTAHEQAVGVGVPVVSLHPDPQGKLGWYRGRQQGLLGEALVLVPEHEQAAGQALLRLFQDESERQYRGAVGRERMGVPGGARRMAEWVAAEL